MLHTIVAALALGIAGFDPLGFFALIAAMAVGAKRSGIAVLMGTIVGSTFLFGLVPALVLGPAVWKLSHAMRGVGHTVWGPLVVVVGIALAVWGVVRLIHPPRPDAEEREAPRSTRPRALAATGIMVGLSAFIDPAFYGGIVLGARQSNPLMTALVILLWILMSHSALIVVGLATLMGLYRPVHDFIETVRARWGRTFGLLASIALVAVGIFCVVEGIAEWHGHWLMFENLRPHRRP